MCTQFLRHHNWVSLYSNVLWVFSLWIFDLNSSRIIENLVGTDCSIKLSIIHDLLHSNSNLNLHLNLIWSSTTVKQVNHTLLTNLQKNLIKIQSENLHQTTSLMVSWQGQMFHYTCRIIAFHMLHRYIQINFSPWLADLLCRENLR